ncbi:Os09g0269000, partial [Oryza sativa Japonica Group]
GGRGRKGEKPVLTEGLGQRGEEQAPTVDLAGRMADVTAHGMADAATPMAGCDGGPSGGGARLEAAASGGGGGEQRDGGGGRVCYMCGEEGHKARDCS